MVNLDFLQVDSFGVIAPGGRIHLDVACRDCIESDCIDAAVLTGHSVDRRPSGVIRRDLDGVIPGIDCVPLERYLANRLATAQIHDDPFGG